MIAACDVVVRRGQRVVLDSVDVSADHHTTVGIVGPNGAGKSTLLSALYRNVAICSGRITVSDRDLSTMSRRDIARDVAVVSQTPDQALPLTVRDTVALGRLPHRSLMAYGDAADREIVDAALARTDLTGMASRLVTQLSGGERQRVLVARAIAQQAGHLLLDEPTNHLDIGHQFALLNLVRSIDSTTIIVLHDLNLAARVADQLVLLDKGHLVASGPCEEVLRPDLLSDVYRVGVERITHNGRIHLLFNPPNNEPPKQ
ncbi:ABC transporter ATP-binding protein [Cutibacterium sp. WCA-380-WT-3A]|uniref:ABC transporter ATP-binding protein n=1 Tax=Cutibacterium porci TaxID=2605781 RepID=A0A7K0J512_9ACTN|nr:ABC transporter ATP-binding protein [Cutibacterium porci]MSS45025.1 ABC transporter ATP-binding protein [Cutibacterium porci]